MANFQPNLRGWNWMLNLHKPIFLFFLLLGICFQGFAQRPVLTIPVIQNGWITAFKITPNGKYLVSAASDRSVKVYELKSKRELFVFWEHTGYVTSISIAADNRTVVSGDIFGDVIIWDLNTGKVLNTPVKYIEKNVSAINISNDGKTAYAAGANGVIFATNLVDKKMAYHYIYNPFPITKTILSKSGAYLMSISPDTSKNDSLVNIIILKTNNGEPVTGFNFKTILLRSASFSKDEKSIYVVAGNPSEVRGYDIASRKMLFKTQLPDQLLPLDVITLSDEKIVIACLESRRLTFLNYDVKTQQIVKTIKTKIFALDNLSKNILLQTYLDKENEISFINCMDYAIYHLQLDSEKITLLNPEKKINRGSPELLDGELYFGGEDNVFKKWNFGTGQLDELYKGTAPYFLFKRLNNDMLLSSYGKWFVWDRIQLKMKKEIVEDELDGPVKFEISPNKKLIAIIVKDGKIKLYNSSDFSLNKVMEVDSILGVDVTASTAIWFDDNTLAFTTANENNKSIHFFDIRTGTIAKSIDFDRTVLKFVKYNDELLHVVQTGSIKLYNFKTKTIAKEREIDTYNLLVLKYDEKINQVIISLNNDILFLNPTTLSTEKKLVGHNNRIWDVDFSPDYNKIYSTSQDYTEKIWDFKTGSLLGTLLVLDQKDWVTVNKNNLFDASPQAMKQLYYVVNDSTDLQEPWKIIGLEQLKHRYYQPGLLQIQMGYSKEPLRTVPELDHIELAPKLKGSLINDHFLHIDLKNQRGGIGKVVVAINNAEVLADARPKKEADKSLATLAIEIDLNNFSKRFANEENVEIKVTAWNGDNWLSSAAEIIKYNPLQSKGAIVTNNAAKKTTEKPRLFAIVFGTADYSGTQIDLRYASKDAADFANALKASAQKLFGVADVEVNLFSSDAIDPAHQPEKKNLIKAMQEMAAKIKPTDILVTYLSGHGVNFGGADGDFYYLTREAAGADAAYLADQAIRTTSAVSSAELTDLLNKISAKKKILVLDACASGKAAETMLVSARDVPASQVRALDRMQDRTGFYILSGSAADAVSYESSVYGQGLLTYSLLKAMKGAALRIDGGEEYIDIQKLLQYAVDEVPKLAAGIGGIQKPLYRSPDNQQSFDIGKSDELTKQSIQLAEPKPVFVAVGLQDPLELFDKLNLSDKINAAIRENTAKGKNADFVFTEAKDYPGAYEQKADLLTLKYVLIKDKTRVGDVRTFTSAYNDANVFAAYFIDALKAIVK
jgi:WD40 repeat protein